MSLLDPTEEVRKILIGAVVLALTAIFGAIGGCEYKQREWDKDKLAASEAARKLEKHDNSLGHRKIEQLGEDKIIISEAKNWVQKGIEGAPKKLVSCGKIDVLPKDSKVETVEPKKEEAKKNEPIAEDEPVYILPRTMQLYDVSVDPSNAGLRTGTYETVEPITVDEGFKIIFKNDFTCAEDRKQLKRLHERICEKQKLYSQPISEFCQS